MPAAQPDGNGVAAPQGGSPTADSAATRAAEDGLLARGNAIKVLPCLLPLCCQLVTNHAHPSLMRGSTLNSAPCQAAEPLVAGQSTVLDLMQQCRAQVYRYSTKHKVYKCKCIIMEYGAVCSG